MFQRFLMFTFRQAKFTEKDFTVIENRAVASWGELGESGFDEQNATSHRR